MKYTISMDRDKMRRNIENRLAGITSDGLAIEQAAIEIEKDLYHRSREQTKKKAIPFRSKKETKHISRYDQARKVFWESHSGKCEAMCGSDATEVHHYYQYRLGAALYDIKQFVGLCHGCHEICHTKPSVAIEMGILASPEEKAQYKKKMSRWKK
jgi:hypothetical protein